MRLEAVAPGKAARVMELPLGAVGVRVSALVVYPIKSCAGVPVQRLDFSAAGRVAGDREWATTDADGVVTWQGAHPRLALVRPALTDGALQLHAPGMPPIAVPRDQGHWGCEVRLWNDALGRHEAFAAEEAGADVQAWLARVVGAPLRLVRLGEAALSRNALNPLHLVTRPSLQALAEHLRADGHETTHLMARLRPNLVIDADGAALRAFDEEHVAQFEWPDAGAALEVAGPCVRCVVPNVDPQTGRVGDQPLRSLAAMGAQRHPGRPVAFGVYARATAGTGLAVADRGWARLRF
jgi:uncharacterized protein YcbX